MYKEKHTETASARKAKAWKPVAAIIALILVVVLATGGTVAYLTTHTQELTNIFSPSEVMAKVTEETGGVYTIRNDGDVEAYIRVAVVANWAKNNAVKDAFTNSSTVHWKQPEFTVTYDSSWITGNDGFYYYKSPVAAETDISSKLTVKLAEGQVSPSSEYEFTVQVIAEAIQSEPDDAVKEAWEVTVDPNRQISK